jgi:serine phosphatase RsbU (regulator of sigma subunit)
VWSKRSTTRRARESITRLARVIYELSGADNVDTVTKIVTEHIADAVGASIAALAIREGEQVRLIGLRGLPVAEARRWETFPLAMRTPPTDVIRSGRSLVMAGAAVIADAYPDVPAMDRGERTLVVLPLRVAGIVTGSIALSIPGPAGIDPTEVELLEVMADTCGQTLERIDAMALARQQTARLSFLAEASIVLASSLDLDVTLARVTRLAVPTFADWCTVDVVRDGALHRLAVAHVDPEKVALAHRLHERWPPDPAAPTGPWSVVRSGQAELIREISDEMLVAGALDDEQLRVARELHLRSALLVPLLVRGEVIGVLTWVSTDEERLYDEDDLHFAEHLARRAATAIDNSDLHSQTRDAAQQLQRAVHPEVVVPGGGWSVACHYEPSGRTEVGGDFYDGFELADGRYVVFIGDVMGRGVAAAAAMTEMRAATRAFASVDPEPASVVSRLDRMALSYGREQLVTMVYGVADAATGTVVITNAGHPPALVLRADGTVEVLPYADGPPVGLLDGGRREFMATLEVGDSLVLYSDGLIERRGESIDDGLARLARALPAMSDTGRGETALDAGLLRVVDAVRDDTYDDDVAALALHRLPATEHR